MGQGAARRRAAQGARRRRRRNAIAAQVIQGTPDATPAAYFGTIELIALAFAGGMFGLAPWVTRHIKAGADSESEAALQH